MSTLSPTVSDPRPRPDDPDGSPALTVDCDVHNALADPDEILRYLSPRWHTAFERGSRVGSSRWVQYGAARTGVFREDSWPASGPPGSDLDLLRAQLLDRYSVDHAVLHPVLDTITLRFDGAEGDALAKAFNDWMVARWLEEDDRLLGGITIPFEDGPRSAAEIDRTAADRRFAKVVLPVATREPLGSPRYWPIFEAAERHGLPITLHVGGLTGATPSGAGWPSFHLEAHNNWAMPYATQVVSLVCGGVFDAFPGLQIILEEGGLGWMPPLMWRMDRARRSAVGTGSTAPEVPSEVVRRHFWFTTQPLDEPFGRRDLVDVFEMLDMSDRILFASDYPHHDFDAPDRVLPVSQVGPDLRRRIMGDNAATLFARSIDRRVAA